VIGCLLEEKVNIMSKRKDVIRINDRVKIINPERFVRVGYPLTKEMMWGKITDEQKNCIHEMFRKFDIISNPTDTEVYAHFGIDNKLDDGAYERVMDVMAGVLLKKAGWGGKDRKLFTERDERYLGATGKVFDKRVVKTGTYTSGHTYSSYYNGDDYRNSPESNDPSGS
jgi:hypothetical protein